jgi:hypothetical protein
MKFIKNMVVARLLEHIQVIGVRDKDLALIMVKLLKFILKN